MKRRDLRILLTVICAMTLFAGCGKTGNSGTTEAGKKSTGLSGHKPVTINAPYRNIDAFIDLVHEKYPDINIEVVPYSGQNTTSWMRAMLRSGSLTDIYFSTIFYSEADNAKDRLLDLSGYEFTDNYVQARIREVTDDGAVYMLPLSYSCIGITYNKTLLEKNGWTLPADLKEMEALKAKVEKAGYNFCTDLLQYPGYGFQYLCNILDTGFLSSMDGLRWQSDYLAGKANISNSPKLLESMKLLQRWKDIGLLTTEQSDESDAETKRRFVEGNTLFCIGNSSDLSAEYGATDEFKLMPYLSEDGDKNVFIMNVNRYVGLNKNLTDFGNEQKLEDALHIMEVLSTEEGMWALSNQRESALLPLKDVAVKSDSYYSEAVQELNDGHTAPFIYSGWENAIVPVGDIMLDYIKDKAALSDVVACIDETQANVGDASAYAYTTVTEELNTEDCAKLVGIGLAKAAGADAALISECEYHTGEVDMDSEGVSGSLFALPVTDQEIVAILPTGWQNNIETLTLTGARIKELADTGYDRMGHGNTYPYAFVTKEGMELKDDQTYTVVVYGATAAVKEEGNSKDTGILGLEAMKTYLSQFESLSKKDIVWK